MPVPIWSQTRIITKKLIPNFNHVKCSVTRTKWGSWRCGNLPRDITVECVAVEGRGSRGGTPKDNRNTPRGFVRPRHTSYMRSHAPGRPQSPHPPRPTHTNQLPKQKRHGLPQIGQHCRPWSHNAGQDRRWESMSFAAWTCRSDDSLFILSTEACKQHTRQFPEPQCSGFWRINV